MERARRLREKAMELRCLAEDSKTLYIRTTLLSLADDYDKLALYAERRAEEAKVIEMRARGARVLRAVS
jgi:hypothetical protein